MFPVAGPLNAFCHLMYTSDGLSLYSDSGEGCFRLGDDRYVDSQLAFSKHLFSSFVDLWTDVV